MSEKKRTLNRRQFLKATGAAGAVAGGAGLGFFGFQSGRDPRTYTGTEAFEGNAQTFNRKKYEIKGLPYKITGPTSRIDSRTDVIFNRSGQFRRQWKPETGLDGLDPFLREYYEKYPEKLEADKAMKEEVMPTMFKNMHKYHNKFLLSTAWSDAMGAVSPPPIEEPPEISDFPKGHYGRPPQQPVKLKDRKKTAMLIKKIAHQLGSVLVGIARLNPDWVYLYHNNSRGFTSDQPVEVPKHWEYAIVVGTPMSWDPFYANPNYGTSYDAYSKSAIVATRLAEFIKGLGYAARPHTPGFSYDLMVTPIMIDAGLGEQGRMSCAITPELGGNFRPAIVTTNIPVEPDKPIRFGVAEFCKTCKICADQCPSGAITRGGKISERGYEKYQINVEKCYRFWYSNAGNIGCRVCLAACPYTRKSNWLHRGALHMTSKDPTGLSHRALTFLQKQFYPAPDPESYYTPEWGGQNASYRQPPWWLKSEDFIDF